MNRFEIEDDIVNYYGGNEITGYNQKQRELIAGAEKSWWSLPCDPEGPTYEQQAVMDAFISSLAIQVLEAK